MALRFLGTIIEKVVVGALEVRILGFFILFLTSVEMCRLSARDPSSGLSPRSIL